MTSRHNMSHHIVSSMIDSIILHIIYCSQVTLTGLPFFGSKRFPFLNKAVINHQCYVSHSDVMTSRHNMSHHIVSLMIDSIILHFIYCSQVRPTGLPFSGSKRFPFLNKAVIDHQCYVSHSDVMTSSHNMSHNIYP